MSSITLEIYKYPVERAVYNEAKIVPTKIKYDPYRHSLYKQSVTSLQANFRILAKYRAATLMSISKLINP